MHLPKTEVCNIYFNCVVIKSNEFKSFVKFVRKSSQVTSHFPQVMQVKSQVSEIGDLSLTQVQVIDSSQQHCVRELHDQQTPLQK